MSISSSAPAAPSGVKILDGPSNKGLSVFSSFRRANNKLFMDLSFQNNSQTTINNFAIKFNKNYLGVLPATPIKVCWFVGLFVCWFVCLFVCLFVCSRTPEALEASPY